MDTKRIYPVPEILGERGMGWKTEESDEPCIDTTNKVLYVPLGDTEYEIFLRAHEQAHIQFSPKNVGELGATTTTEVDQECLWAVEDARINKIMEARGIPMDFECDVNPREEGIVNTKRSILGYIATKGTGRFDGFRKFFKKLNPLTQVMGNEISKAVDETLEKDIYDFKNTLKAAKMLTEMFNAPQAVNVGMTGSVDSSVVNQTYTNTPSERAKKIQSKQKKKSKPNKKIIPKPYVNPHRSPPSGRTPPQTYEKGIGWGPMKIEEPARVIPIQAANPTFKLLLKEEGVTLRNPYRVYLDQKVFATKKKEYIQGGTVLIDGSGSMALKREEIYKLTTSAPASSVLIYNGVDRQGYLRWLMKNGKMVESHHIERPHGGNNNLVDGPALLYISKLSEPRIWVSDGCVTGMGDLSTQELRQIARNICNTHRIYRVRSVSRALRIFEEIKKSKGKMKIVCDDYYLHDGTPSD